MSTFKDKEFDLCLTDPPYRILENAKLGKGGGVADSIDYPEINWDNEPMNNEQLQEIIRISRNQMIFGGNHFHTILPQSRGWMMWDKRKLGTPCDFADCELIWTSYNIVPRIFYHRWRGFIRDSEMGKERIHPTQKPVKLIEWLLDKANEIKTVIDPFVGSGTTMYACQNRRLDCVGIEISSHYCDLVKQRCFTRRFLDRAVKYEFYDCCV